LIDLDNQEVGPFSASETYTPVLGRHSLAPGYMTISRSVEGSLTIEALLIMSKYSSDNAFSK